MAILDENARVNCWEQWMRENDEGIAINKNVLRAVVNAIDDLFEASLSTFNTTINNAGGASLSPKQKRRLAKIVMARRLG